MDDPNNRNSVRCTATCADGSPCHSRATVGPWAVRGTDPPRGAPHGGGQASVGVPRGNQSIWSHAFYARPGPYSALRQTRRSSNEGILGFPEKTCSRCLALVEDAVEACEAKPVPGTCPSKASFSNTCSPEKRLGVGKTRNNIALSAKGRSKPPTSRLRIYLASLKKRAHGAWHLSKTPFKRAKLSQCLAPALRKLLSVDTCSPEKRLGVGKTKNNIARPDKRRSPCLAPGAIARRPQHHTPLPLSRQRHFQRLSRLLAPVRPSAVPRAFHPCATLRLLVPMPPPLPRGCHPEPSRLW
jgi:hypothetical protein